MAPARSTRSAPLLSPRVIRTASPRNPPCVERSLPRAWLVIIEAPIGIKQNIPGRHSAMPDLYKVESHPQVSEEYAGDIYVIYGDLTKEGLNKLMENVGNIDPYGGAGFLKLDPEEKPALVFARNMYGPPGQADALKTFGLGPNQFTDEEKKARAALRDNILGAEEELTATETAFERSPRKVPAHVGARAYTIGPNHQHPRQLLQPAVGLKRTDEYIDDPHLKLCNDFTKVIGQSSVKALHSYVPAEALETLEAQVDSINMPRIGPHNNTTTPAFQLNMAAAVGPNESVTFTHVDPDTGETIEASEGISQLGAFGVIHIDGHDLTAGFTSMHMLSKDDSRVEEQLFFLVELGICWVLHGDCSYGFSGLHMHGGSAPVFKTAQPVNAPPYICITAVAYCPTHFFEGTSSWSFGAAPLKGKQKAAEVFRIAPEMQVWSHDSFFKERPFTNSPNMISDGLSIMDPEAYLDFMARGIVQFATYLILQAPAEVLVRLDRDAILAAISLVKDNQRIVAQPWPRGPGWSSKDCAEGPLSMETMEALKAATTWEHYRALQASDDSELRDLPFGNALLNGAIAEAYEALCRDGAAGIPVCALAEQEGGPVGGTAQKRRSIFKKSRAGGSSKSSETKTAQKKKAGTCAGKRKAEAEVADGPPAKRTRQHVTYDQDSECDSNTEPTTPLLQALELIEFEQLYKHLGTYVLELVGDDLDSWNGFLDAAESDKSEDVVALLGNAAAHLRFLKA
ncbi:hypothetical protein CPB85DRAFT_1439942 [Mucidula mucida]|nr:hypothetical protein CPB85DRAFT_1439942 [Mucidula mucida]